MGTKFVRAAAVMGMIAVSFIAGIAQAGSGAMPTGGRTTQPVGHYEFCRTMPEECRPLHRASARGPVELTRALWSQMIDVNNGVNATVVPMTDMEIWGREEVWSYPVDGLGDCEDFVLEKRRLLMALGIPAGNLLITVVRQPNGDGHAVLTVTTSLGDFILDNLEPRILAWQETDYTYLKRQSDRNPGAWVAIQDDRSIAVGSVERN